MRQLLLHRHKLVGMRRQVKNELQHLALNQGVQQKRKLWSEAGRQRLEELPLTGWTAQRREDSLELLDELNRRVAKLDVAAQQEADERCGGALVADASRSGSDHGAGVFADAGRDRALRAQPPGGQLFGAESGGAFQRRAAAAGGISKQGNPMLRSLLVEAGQSAARCVPELKRAYQRLKHRKHSGVGKVMVARKLAVRLFWMWKTQQPYTVARTQGSPGHHVVAG